MFVQKNPSTQVAHNGGLGAQRLARTRGMDVSPVRLPSGFRTPIARIYGRYIYSCYDL